jgi:hypothetical protein
MACLILPRDVPETRAVEKPEQGPMIAIPQVGDYTTDTSDSSLSRTPEPAVAPRFGFFRRIQLVLEASIFRRMRHPIPEANA